MKEAVDQKGRRLSGNDAFSWSSSYRFVEYIAIERPTLRAIPIVSLFHEVFSRSKPLLLFFVSSMNNPHTKTQASATPIFIWLTRCEG
jgi:hypothetical protein